MLEKIALQKKLITKEQCINATLACKNADQYENALKNYFIDNDLLSEKQIEHLANASDAIKIIRHTIKFGSLAIKMGLISKDVLRSALEEQKKTAAKNKRPVVIGKILIRSGILTAKQVQKIVLEQKKLNLSVKTISKDEVKNNKNQDSKDIPVENAVTEEKKEQAISRKIRGNMLLEIDQGAMGAYLIKQEGFDDKITPEDIISAIMSFNIVFGIENIKSIQSFISSSGFKKKPFRIAKGIKAIQGVDAKIEYYFETDYLKAGGVDAEGKIDFKERGEVPKIDIDTLLTEKFPLKESKNGRNIYGEELIVPPARDFQLKCQNGCLLSKDETKIYSEISGYPKLSLSGNVSVLDTFMIKEDVDYQTGHIDYNGDITANGCLKNGFKIKGNNIKIGEIDGGTVYATGNIQIAKGVNNAKIYSRGNISAQYIHDSEIQCLGNVTVKSEIVDSKIQSSGACLIEKGELINSKITSNHGILVKNLGTEKTHPNIIKVGIDTFITNESKKIEKTILINKNEISKLERKKETHSENIESNNRDSIYKNFELDQALEKERQIKNDLQAVEKNSNQDNVIKKINLELSQIKVLITNKEKEVNSCFDKIETNKNQFIEAHQKVIELEDEIEDLSNEKLILSDWEKANPGKAEVTILGKVYSGTFIQGRNTKKELLDNLDNVTVKELKLDQNTSGGECYEIFIQEKSRRR